MNTLKKLYFISRIGLVSGVLAASHISGDYAFSQQLTTTQTESRVAEERSLETLAKEGLPERMRGLGFKLGEYVKRPSEKELIIVAENHDAKKLKEKESQLIKFLIERYSAEAIGFEGCSGKYPHLKSPIEFGLFTNSSARGYTNGDNILLYGMSSESVMESALYLDKIKLLIIGKYPPCVIYEEVKGFLKRGGSGDKNLDKILIKESERQRSFFENQEKKENILRTCDGIKLPEDLKSRILKCLKDESINAKALSEFLYLDSVYDYEKRSEDFARNIKKSMETEDKKRGIILVGAGHMHSDAAGMKNVVDFLPYSYLVIYGPEIDKTRAIDETRKCSKEEIEKDFDSKDRKLREKVKEELEKLKNKR